MTAELVLVADTLVRATPLMIAGLGVAIAFRGGVFNIGAEGQLLIGAVAATITTLSCGRELGAVTPIFAMAAGAVGGAAWAGIAAELKKRFGVLEIISTIMLNFIAVYLVSYLVRGPLQEPTRIFPQSRTFPPYTHLPILIPGTRLHLGFAAGVALSILIALLLRHTAAGFRIRAVGSSARAAASAGQIDVARTSLRIFLLSGALAGIAGSIEVNGVTFALYENLSPGYGYTAIAVALIAGLNPLAVILSGILFGALETGAIAMQREFAVPSSLATVVEAILILATVAAAAFRGKSLVHKAAIP